MIHSRDKAIPLYTSDSFSIFEGTLVHENRLYHGDTATKIFETNFKLQWLSEVEGMFRFVMKDDGDTICFGTDRYGLLPLFYRFEERLEIFFNPWQHRDKFTLNDASWCMILAGGITMDDYTAYQGVMECLPGVLYRFDRLKRTLTQHVWSDNTVSHSREHLPTESPFNHLLPVLDDPDTRYELALTAGLDSRLVLSDALRKGIDLDTFTYGLEDEPDMTTASQLALKAQTLHRSFSFDQVSAKPAYTDSRIVQLVETGFHGRNVPQESGWIASNRMRDPGRVIITGHGGNWVAGNALTNEVLEMKTRDELAVYLTWKACYNTAHSSREFTAFVRELLQRSLDRIPGDSIPAIAEKWSLDNPKRKFHTGYNYFGKGYPVFYPFYQSKVVKPFLDLRLTERYKQMAYSAAAQSFIESAPKEIGQIPINGKSLKKCSDSLKHHVSSNRMITRRSADPGNRMRKLLLPSEFPWREPYSYFGTGGFLSFMKSRMDKLFPKLEACESYLRGSRCKMAADHLHWVRHQQVAQMSPNGVMCCAFLPAMLGIEEA